MQKQKYFARLNLWLNERFPLMNFISGAFIYLLAKSIHILDQDGQIFWHWQDALGVLVPMMHLFLLRVFDEHKDHDTDKVHYPNRVVQRGIFTLKEIRALGYGAFAVQLLAVTLLKPTQHVWMVYALVWVWTLLMTKEFFIKEYLKKNLFLYGLSHLVITPLIFLCSLVIACGQINMTDGWIVALALSFLTGWIYEVTRKTKGAEEETGDMSYSKLWGRSKSSLIIFVSILATQVLIYYFFKSLNISLMVFYAGAFVLTVLTALTLMKFVKQPTAKNRKGNEGVTSLSSLFAFLTPIICSFL